MFQGTVSFLMALFWAGFGTPVSRIALSEGNIWRVEMEDGSWVCYAFDSIL